MEIELKPRIRERQAIRQTRPFFRGSRRLFSHALLLAGLGGAFLSTGFMKAQGEYQPAPIAAPTNPQSEDLFVYPTMTSIDYDSLRPRIALDPPATETPTPTITPTLIPTSTPEPTSTPRPSSTPAPRATEAPRAVSGSANCEGQRVKATHYHPSLHGGIMRWGGEYDRWNSSIAAYNHAPGGTRLQLKLMEEPYPVAEYVVRDTGGDIGANVDLSEAGFMKLAPLGRGRLDVCLVILGR